MRHDFQIQVRDDGVWLTFTSQTGKVASICAEALADHYAASQITRDAIRLWCAEEHEAARGDETP